MVIKPFCCLVIYHFWHIDLQDLHAKKYVLSTMDYLLKLRAIFPNSAIFGTSITKKKTQGMRWSSLALRFFYPGNYLRLFAHISAPSSTISFTAAEKDSDLSGNIDWGMRFQEVSLRLLLLAGPITGCVGITGSKSHLTLVRVEIINGQFCGNWMRRGSTDVLSKDHPHCRIFRYDDLSGQPVASRFANPSKSYTIEIGHSPFWTAATLRTIPSSSYHFPGTS